MAPRPRFDKDYYAIIGLRPGATEDDIRRAYRRLALEWHPDRNPGNPEAGERFKEISEAYAVLIDPARRRAYEAARRTAGTGEFRPSREDLFRDLFADARASAIFDELAREFARMGMRADRRSFEQTLFGGRVVVTGGVFVITPFTPVLALLRLTRAALRGARAPAAPASATPLPRPPGALGALGRLGRWFLGLPSPAASPPAPPASHDLVVPLRLTAGEAAQGGRRRVTLARGSGAEDVLVTIPPGIRSGTRLRLRGKGDPGPRGLQGDAYLAVEVSGAQPPPSAL